MKNIKRIGILAVGAALVGTAAACSGSSAGSGSGSSVTSTRTGLYYKAMLIKAGVKMPGDPTTWQQILQVAAKVRAANPGVWPLWVGAGVAAGPTNVLQGSGNLIFGSSDTAMFDAKTNKWVVNSSGIRATF